MYFGGFLRYDRKKKKLQSSVWRVVLLCQFSVLAITTGKKNDTVVCLLGARFWWLRPKKKDTVVCLAGCAVVSVFGSGGKSAVFFCGGKVLLWPEKKDTVVCLAGARSLLQPEKKIQSSVWWVRDHYYDRKKKRYSRLSGGCAIMSVFLVAIIIFVLVQLELNLIQIR